MGPSSSSSAQGGWTARLLSLWKSPAAVYLGASVLARAGSLLLIPLYTRRLTSKSTDTTRSFSLCSLFSRPSCPLGSIAAIPSAYFSEKDRAAGKRRASEVARWIALISLGGGSASACGRRVLCASTTPRPCSVEPRLRLAILGQRRDGRQRGALDPASERAARVLGRGLSALTVRHDDRRRSGPRCWCSTEDTPEPSKRRRVPPIVSGLVSLIYILEASQERHAAESTARRHSASRSRFFPTSSRNGFWAPPISGFSARRASSRSSGVTRSRLKWSSR